MKQNAKRERLNRRQKAYNDPKAESTRRQMNSGARKMPGSYRR